MLICCNRLKFLIAYLGGGIMVQEEDVLPVQLVVAHSYLEKEASSVNSVALVPLRVFHIDYLH